MSTTIFTYDGKVLVNGSNNKWLKKYVAPVDPYNPLGLPAGVMRFEAEAGWSPSGYDTSSLAFTQVSETPNVWDLQVLNGSGMNNGASGSMTKILGFNATGLTGYSRGLENRIAYSRATLVESSPMYLPGYVGYGNGLFQACAALEKVGALYTPDLENAYNMFFECTSLISVEGFTMNSITRLDKAFENCTSLVSFGDINAPLCTTMEYLFDNCRSLTHVGNITAPNCLNLQYAFNSCANLTSVGSISADSCTNASYMFMSDGKLTSIPTISMSSVENVFAMCTNTYKVESGILALYNYLSSLGAQVTSHMATFENCGRDTVTGAAELAQIPSSWGGTGA